MVRKTTGFFAIIVLAGMVQVGGCASILPAIPIPLDLGLAGVDQFDVQAGTPTTLKADFSGDPFELQARRGTIEIDPSAIVIMSANGGGGKLRNVNQQATNVCVDACLSAGVDADTCTAVCDGNELKISIWIGTTAEIVAACENGDRYDFDVTLSDGGVPTSVTTTPSSLTLKSIALINEGNFSICIQVISPIDGTVLIDEVVLNVGL